MLIMALTWQELDEELKLHWGILAPQSSPESGSADDGNILLFAFSIRGYFADYLHRTYPTTLSSKTRRMTSIP